MRPLTLLVTRPEPEATHFAEAARAHLDPRVHLLVSPVLTIRFATEPLSFAEVAGLLLTSRNGVRALTGQAPPGLAAWCVGRQTTLAAREAGLEARMAGETAEAAFDTLRRTRPAGPLLHLRGRHARGDLAARLTAAGVATRELVVYQQEPRALTKEAARCLAGPDPILVPLFSPRSAALLADAARTATAPLRIAAMSSAVARVWGDAPAETVRVAARPDAPAMLAALASLAEGSAT